ncbi:hypothetical protein Tco_1413910, partial [Tanacetum coccineum]
ERQILSSSPLPDKWVILEKIKVALSNVYWSYLNVNGGLIQFWAPVLYNNRRLLLSTFDQPYSIAADSLNSCRFHECRSLSVDYHYSILNDDDYVSDPMIICDGSVRTAFLNHFAAVRPARSGNCLVFPVFDYSPQTKNSSFSTCVGVVECFIKGSSSLVQLFVALKTAMQIVGLSTFQECHIYDTIPGLTHAADEIQNALRIICASHGLPFGQVWIPYETQNSHHHVPDNQTTKLINPLKLIGYCDYYDGDLMSSLKEYCSSCDMFPLRIGEGLVGKALETYEPFFCSNIRELRLLDYWRLMSHNIECSCLAISLRSNDNIVFAFEFLWPTSRNHFILLESILLTLKRCLPSFNFASGAQIGDELHVLDVENSTGSGLGFFKIFEKNISSQIPKALEERRRSLVVDECMSSLKVDCTTTPNPLTLEDFKQSERFTQEAAPNVKEHVCTLKHESNVGGISEWQRAISVKRKFSELCESQMDSNQEDNREHSGNSSNSLRYSGNNEVIIEAEYEDQRILLHLPISSKVADIKKHIDDKYKLCSGCYILQFLDFEDEWIRLDDDGDWESCIISWRTACTQTIRVRVQPSSS